MATSRHSPTRLAASSPAAGAGRGLDELLNQAQILRGRVQRLTVALALAEDVAADEFERVAGRSKSPESTLLRGRARVARAEAATCRGIGAALERAAG
jgi:hypothetical protein